MLPDTHPPDDFARGYKTLVGRRASPKSALTAGARVRVLCMLRFEDVLPSSSDFCYQCVPTTNKYDSNDDCDNDDVDDKN